MIISNLIGGLGNQMFQYAAGLALARRHDVPLRLDIRGLQTYKLHNGFQLDDIFNGDFRVASSFDLLKVLKHRALVKRKIAYEIDSRFRLTGNSTIIRQPIQNYWSEFEHLGQTCYLAGYWQSEQYFGEFVEDIRSAFAFRELIPKENLTIYRQIQRTNSVAVHVRLGDYRTNPETAEFHGRCGPDYYQRAISQMSSVVEGAKFFIFSDEPDFAKEVLPQRMDLEFVNVNSGAVSYRDMRLQAACNHHIIANSSFSWWGAWLGQSEGQVVIAPKIWFSGSEEIMTDIYAREWHRL